MKKYNVALKLVLLSGLTGFAGILSAQEGPQIELTDAEQAWLLEHPTLRIAPAPAYPPIEFFADNGEYRGIAADFAKLLESKLGIKFEVLRFDTWNDVVDATRKREVDVWMEAGNNAERREFMDFSSPYLKLPAVIITQKKTTGELNLADLVGLRVAVPKGYATQTFIEEQQPDISLLLVPSIADGLERVSFGSADTLVANVAVASFYIEQLGLANLRVAGDSGYVWELSMAARNDWPLLIGILQKGLDSISEEEQREILRKWVAMEAEDAGFSALDLTLALLIFVLAALLVIQLVHQRRKDVSTELSPAIIKRSWPIMAAALTVITIVIMGYFWGQAILAERARQDIQNAIETVLNTTGQAVIAWFRARENEIQFWASLEPLRNATTGLVETPRSDLSAYPLALSRFRSTIDTLMAGKSYEGFTLMTLDGEILASDTDELSTAEDPWDIDSIEGLGFNQDIVANVLTSAARPTDVLAFPPGFIEEVLASNGQIKMFLPEEFAGLSFPSIVVGAGIPDDSGVARAVLAFHIDPQQEYSEILQRGQIGESGETYAINRYGQLISESRFDEDLVRIGLIDAKERSILNIEMRDPGVDLTRGGQAASPRQQQPLTKMANSATGKKSSHDMLGYNDYRGVPVVGAWIWDDVYDVGITTEMDVAEAYASFTNYRQQAQIATAVTIFLIIALTTMFIRTRVRMAAANAKLEEAYAIIKLHSDRMEEELNVGREIQMSMIPLTFPAFPDNDEFSIHAVLEPAREVGGDFYDFFFVDENHFCVCIGDVSGKGVPAALFMAVTKTLIKSRAGDNTSTADIITHVNNEVSVDNASSMFVTIFIAIVDIQTGDLIFTNAGHNPPYLKRADRSMQRLDGRHGPVVGAMDGIDYKEETLRMCSGDLLIIYTDGVTEAMDKNRNLFEEQRFAELMASDIIQTAEDVTRETLNAVKVFEGDTEQTDDCTILAFRYKGAGTDHDKYSWSMDIENNLVEIPRVIEAIETHCKNLPLPLSPGRKLKVAIDEILNNIISYAYDNDEKRNIGIKVDPINDGIILTVTDDGVPFNPLAHQIPDTSLSMDERKPGGLGIHLVQNMVDDARYQRVDSHNVLKLTIYFDRDMDDTHVIGG